MILNIVKNPIIYVNKNIAKMQPSFEVKLK